MLNNLMCKHVKNGKRVLPLKMSSRPGEDLKLNEALPKALQAVNLPRYYPEQVEDMLEKVNETSKRRTGSAVAVHLQLTPKSRGDKFSRDACDDIASTLGAFARHHLRQCRVQVLFGCLRWRTSSKLLRGTHTLTLVFSELSSHAGKEGDRTAWWRVRKTCRCFNKLLVKSAETIDRRGSAALQRGCKKGLGGGIMQGP